MPDRPLECSHCKKPPKVIYKEIVEGSIVITEMCADCPVLSAKLGKNVEKATLTEAEASLGCGNCHTNLETLKMGGPLGCSECYAIFAGKLIDELIAADRISPRMKKAISSGKNQSIHLGTSPNKPAEIATSSKAGALKEALNEALRRENYEQAAILRDQIKNLKEEKPNAQ